MNVYVVFREGCVPEGAFETRKLADEYVRDRCAESDDRDHQIETLEFVKVADRPDSDTLGFVTRQFGTVFNE